MGSDNEPKLRRKCSICGKSLSFLNPNRVCFFHLEKYDTIFDDKTEYPIVSGGMCGNDARKTQLLESGHEYKGF